MTAAALAMPGKAAPKKASEQGGASSAPRVPQAEQGGASPTPRVPQAEQAGASPAPRVPQAGDARPGMEHPLPPVCPQAPEGSGASRTAPDPREHRSSRQRGRPSRRNTPPRISASRVRCTVSQELPSLRDTDSSRSTTHSWPPRADLAVPEEGSEQSRSSALPVFQYFSSTE